MFKSKRSSRYGFYGRCRRLAFLTVTLSVAACASAPKPEDPKLTSFAYDEIKAERYKEAIGHLHDRLKADPRDGNAVFLLAVAHSRLGEYEIAAHDLEVYLRHGGKNPEASYEYGTALFWSGTNLPLATKELEEYRSAHPQSAKANVAVGMAYLSAKRFKEAEGAFKQAQGQPDGQPAALFWLAVLEKGRNNDAAARKYLDELLASAPNSPEVATLKRAAEAAQKAQQ